MRVETMRAVDRRLGRPLAWLLTRLRRLRSDRPPKPPGEVGKVLFVKLSEMGALMLSAPAFAEAERLFPNAERWIVCFGENSEIAQVAGGFEPDRVVSVASDSLTGVIGGLLGAIRRLRRERFDVIVDLEYFSRVSALLTYMARAPVRAGFHRFEGEGLYCGDLYTHRATFNPYLHIAQSYVALVRSAAADAADAPLLKDPAPGLEELDFPRFFPEPDEVEGVRGVLRDAGVPGDAELLLVNPNSSDLLPLRRWPEGRFVELCESLLAARPGAWIALTGASHERELGERILVALRNRGDGEPRCVSLIGRTDLRQLLVLFGLARILVSADSGPPHFAAMTDIRGVTLFGPETPRLYGPVNDRNTAIFARLACSPCIHAWNRRVSTCRDNQCMKRITVREVVDEVRRALG